MLGCEIEKLKTARAREGLIYCSAAAASEEIYGTKENAESYCAELGIRRNSECNLSAEAVTLSVKAGWHP